jgi:acyl carrier protein phosphodiesterase
MNFLAHFYLSENDDELLLGNLLGEFVKGRVEQFSYPGTTERVRTGIRLHRTIDAFTDQHPVVKHSQVPLKPRYGRLAGVLVDLFYDHVLARRWAGYSSVPLPDFTQGVYEVLRRNRYRLPTGVVPLVDSMTQHDWLTRYADPEGIGWALRGLARRSVVARGIGTATEELQTHYETFAVDFDAFFPDLQAHCRHFVHS